MSGGVNIWIESRWYRTTVIVARMLSEHRISNYRNNKARERKLSERIKSFTHFFFAQINTFGIDRREIYC